MRTVGLDSRYAALQILAQVRHGRPLDAALAQNLADLPDPDRRLAHELAAGVLRQQSALDRQLARLVTRNWRRVDGRIQDILRLGAYQLTTLDKVPAHAAVDTSVALAKDAAGAGAAGLVNAVLRRLARAEVPFRAEEDEGPAELAERFSHPAWLVQRWVANFGMSETERLLRWNNSRPRLALQPAREGLERLASRWREADIEVEYGPYHAGLITNRTRPADLPGFGEGHFIAQDPAQALLGRYVDGPNGARVYDACAAPGGKTIALGRSSGLVIAGDVSRFRARKLAENLRRAGSGREYTVVADARHPPVRAVDVVLVDAPCLGTGTFARHPDARWRTSPHALSALERLQADLLERTSELVAAGGLLVYSTCSLEPEENTGQVHTFLSAHPEFHREPSHSLPSALLSANGDLTILPQRHGMDGVYAARLRRHS